MIKTSNRKLRNWRIKAPSAEHLLERLENLANYLRFRFENGNPPTTEYAILALEGFVKRKSVGDVDWKEELLNEEADKEDEESLHP